MASLELTDANTSHAHEVGEIVRVARHEAYGQLGADFINAMHDDVGGYNTYFRRQIEESYYSLVALMGQKLAGIALVDVIDDQPTALRLSWLYIDRAHQGTGIGSQLLDDVITHARIDGFLNLTLNVFSGNERAIGLYASRGFAHVGCLLRPYYEKLGQGFMMDMKL
jgi:ribosomal protein S18 acetylase RimI-like enzyme